MKSLMMIIALFLFAFTGTATAQHHMHGHVDDKKTEKETVKEKDSHNHSSADKDSKSAHCCEGMKDHSTHSSDAAESNTIVREGTIDLKSFDKNNDGKVYQDQMCWNVISDEP